MPDSRMTCSDGCRAVARHRLGQVRGQDDGVVACEAGQLVDRRSMRDVGVEVDRVVVAAVEQRREQPGLERGGELDQLVATDISSSIVSGEPISSIITTSAPSDLGPLVAGLVDEQHVERAVGVVRAEGVDEHLRLGEIVAGDDRACVERVGHQVGLPAVRLLRSRP